MISKTPRSSALVIVQFFAGREDFLAAECAESRRSERSSASSADSAAHDLWGWLRLRRAGNCLRTLRLCGSISPEDDQSSGPGGIGNQWTSSPSLTPAKARSLRCTGG